MCFPISRGTKSVGYRACKLEPVSSRCDIENPPLLVGELASKTSLCATASTASTATAGRKKALLQPAS